MIAQIAAEFEITRPTIYRHPERSSVGLISGAGRTDTGVEQ